MVITRFAPSPTGHLHIGGARTAIFNWLFAKSKGGKFILRIEDTDTSRSTKENIESIIKALKWLELDWDEGPFFQTERIDIYKEYVQKLIDKGLAYYCKCTPEEVEEMRRIAMEKGEKPKYNGRCRELNLGPGEGRVVRFKTPLEGETGYKDELKGFISVNNKELDDFILLRSDGTPTYNLAVVVDDALMKVTHVIRGDDHISNTPKQVLLYQAFGFELPKFIHVPMILGEDRKKLSKRHGAMSVLEYKEMGYLPEALINYLVRLGWSYGNQEIFDIEELIEKFSLKGLSNSACIFNPEKLKWVNAQHIKRYDDEKLAVLLREFLNKRGLDEDIEYLKRIVPMLKPRAATLIEMADLCEYFVIEDEKISYDPSLVKKFFSDEVLKHLNVLVSKLEDLDIFEEKKLEEFFRTFVSDQNIKFKLIAQPIRLAITGRTASPGLFEVMAALGKEKVLNRLKRCIAFASEL